ncbi:MAG: hypothetical protein CL985_05360 [Euryarchaeota archaeon]|nr:hypothetical protein [Euryarchaeota archaeon]
MTKDPRIQRPVLSNRLVSAGAWAVHTRPVSILRIRFKNLRCRDNGAEEDPLLVHATRLVNELEAISSRDVQQVFGLPLNLSQKLLEMLLYRDLIQPSLKQKSRLSERQTGFLFESDPDEERRHRQDTEFDQLYELTESGQLAATQGEIRPIVPKNITLYMIEETGEFLPLDTTLAQTKDWDEPRWKKTRLQAIASIVPWFEGEQRNARRVDDSIEGVSLEETVRRDDFGIEQEKWPATMIQSCDKAIVPGIWASTVLKDEPYLDLAKANSAIELIQSSNGSWSRKSDGLAGKITLVPFRNGSYKPQLHQKMISVEVEKHEHRDLPGLTQPKPHRVRIPLKDMSEVEALVRPIPAEKKIAEWCDDMVDTQMRKLPEGSLGRPEVNDLVHSLRTSAMALWSDSHNQTKSWHNTLMANLESINLESILARYRNMGEWELQYRIDEQEVFQNAD